MAENVILVCGSRDWTNGRAIYERLSQEPAGTVVIEGEANGADKLAKYAALLLGFRVIECRANWTQYGKGAGMVRNRQMLDMGPCRVIAFHPDLASSRGTRNCIEQAMARKIPVEVINQ